MFSCLKIIFFGPQFQLHLCDYFSSHIPSRHEREVSEFRKLEREKSFDEARTAVQSQIEKIFMKTAAAAAGNGPTNTTANNAKGKNAAAAAVAAAATNNVRLSRRDQEQATSPPGKTTKKHLAATSSPEPVKYQCLVTKMFSGNLEL